LSVSITKRDALRLRLLVITAVVGMRRETHAAQIRDDDGVILCHCLGERRHHVAGIAKAVQHHDRRALTPDADVDCRTIGFDLLGAKAGRKRLEPRAAAGKVPANAKAMSVMQAKVRIGSSPG